MSYDVIRKGEWDKSWAEFSECGRYRYTLFRRWNPEGSTICFVGLNPSTADETADDPTMRRCIGFAKSWGFHAMIFVNLFAYRATDPADMKSADSPAGLPCRNPWNRPEYISPENHSSHRFNNQNDLEILEAATNFSDMTVCCWGNHGQHQDRARDVLKLLADDGRLKLLHCFSITKTGQPIHPLYLKSDCRPVPMPGYENAKAWAYDWAHAYNVYEDRLYRPLPIDYTVRQELPGEPTVEDILRPGMFFRCHYYGAAHSNGAHSTVYRVHSVRRAEEIITNINTVSWRVTGTRAGTDSKGYFGPWVYIDGQVRHLFEHNKERIEILPDVTSNDFKPASAETGPVQLELF